MHDGFDLDAYAKGYEERMNRQNKFESLLLTKTKKELEYRLNVISDFNCYDTKKLKAILQEAIKEIDTLC